VAAQLQWHDRGQNDCNDTAMTQQAAPQVVVQQQHDRQQRPMAQHVAAQL